MSCAAMLRKLIIPKNKVGAGFIGLKSSPAFTTTCTRKQQESSNVVSKFVRTICDPFLALPRTFTTVMHMTSNDWAIKGCECKIAYYTIMVRYGSGKKLLRADATIIKRLLTKITQGKCLSREERQLLTRATADIFRLVPGSMFLAVPCIQFVLPLLLRFYPNILSPSFQDKITGQERVMRNLKARTEYAKFLRETAIEMAKVAQNSQSGHIKPLAEEFMRFWVDFGVCRPVSSEDIFHFTKLFSDELTLDHVSSNDWAIKGCECKIAYYTIMVRYGSGKKLLRADATIIKRLLTKITQGKCLSREERQLLTRATADIFRLVPGSMFLAVPSIQFVLPLLLRFYPNILSPSFQDKITGQERVMRNLKARTEYAKFLRETAIEMAKVAQNSQSGHIKPLAEEFMRFWVDFGVCRPVSSEDILHFTKLFSDELTLDHVSRPFMADMCKAMGITPFGIDEYLRFVLREKLKSNDWAIKGCECKIVYNTIMVRYRLGKKLRSADATIIKRLLTKITQGKCLSRRERQLLTRATADIFRLVPGSMFLAVPSIQFVLPLLLRFCPNILSPSFQDKITGQEQVMRNLKARTEYAKFLRETATEMAKVAQNSQSGHIKPLAEEFMRFWVDFGVYRPVSSEDIFRFTKLFSDELTLDHVSRPFMADMCKAMGITPFETDEYLCFVHREKLKLIKNDDKLIQSKGVEALSEFEVRKACRQRGIHVAKDMRQQYALVGVSCSPIRVQRRGFASVPLPRIRTKDMGALTSKLSELKNVPRPHPKPMYPSAYVPRGGIPPYEAVTRYVAIQRGPMVFDLRIDVWPDPFCWMVHGIWPAYVSGDWLVHYKLEEPDSYEFYMMKEQVKKEILSLDHNTKEILHEIWQSYGDYYEDIREQDVDFWAYQKVVHCWDLLNCPQGHYFHMTAKFGKFVRDTLLNWTRKSTYTPNNFYTSKEIRGQLKMLFGVVVHLIVKADDDMDYDPDSTEIPFLHSLGFLIAEDPTQVVWYKFHDHPTGKVKVPQGNLYMLM